MSKRKTPERELSIAALADLKASGIGRAEIDALHIMPGTMSKEGWRIPFPTVSGAYVDYWRERLIPIPVDGPKYYSTAAGSRLLFPQLPSLDWDAIRSDPTIAIAGVEGEKKSIASCLHSLPTFAITGVDSWNSPDDLNAIKWQGREVFLIPDRDPEAKTETRKNVRRATHKFATELQRRGATVRIVEIPDMGDTQAKIGWDDFIVMHDLEVPRVLQEAKAFVSGEERIIRDDLRPMTIAEGAARPVPMWLVWEILQENGLGVVWAPWSGAKTFLLIDMTMAIARGVPWFGLHVKPAGVFYVATEGRLDGRLAAYLKVNDLQDVPNFRYREADLNLLLSDGDVLDLIHWGRQTKAEMRTEQFVMVIDVLANAIPGGEENAVKDMSRVMSNARRIMSAVGCSVIFAAHSGKDVSKGIRGSSFTPGAIDLSMQIEEIGDKVFRATTPKVKEADDRWQQVFALRQVDLGPMPGYPPELDKRRTSCVVVKSDAPVAEVSESEAKAVQAYDELRANGPVTLTAWRAAVYKLDSIDETDTSAKRLRLERFRRAKDALSRRRLLWVNGGTVYSVKHGDALGPTNVDGGLF